jgi:hypothetical protein
MTELTRRKRQPKADKAEQVEASAGPVPIGKQDIKRSALETWRKLDTVIQKELSLIMKGDKEITASTAAAVIKFIEASADLAKSPEDFSEKDVKDRHQTIMTKLTLPTFDDDDSEQD